MKTSIWTRFIVTALVGCVVAVLATPAAGQGGDDLTLRRDGSKAVPFVADLSSQRDDSSSGLVLRRDGSKAEPFVANRGTGNVPRETAASADGFDWGDAAIGAGLGVAAALLGVAGAYTVRRRPSLQEASNRGGSR